MSDPVEVNYVVYYHDLSPHCRELFPYVQSPRCPPSVLMQDIAPLRAQGQELPDWLDGVPVLADARLGLAFKGADALEVFRKIIEQYESERAPQTQPNENGGSPVTAANPYQQKFIEATEEKKGQKLDVGSLDNYRRMREQQVPPSKQIPQ